MLASIKRKNVAFGQRLAICRNAWRNTHDRTVSLFAGNCEIAVVGSPLGRDFAAFLGFWSLRGHRLG